MISESQACVSGRSMAAHIVRAEAWALTEHVHGREDSSLVLTDYFAAFPSLSVNWFLTVLGAMGIPRFIAKCYRVLYSHNTILGRVFGGIVVSRGVRQGDPASMVLFCLGTATLQEYIGRRCWEGLRLKLECAGDCLYGLRGTLPRLSPRFQATHELDAAVGCSRTLPPSFFRSR
eukprot:2316598-Pyramimonas_sp.AAC.1